MLKRPSTQATTTITVAAQPQRGGFTLMEMLVVVAIIVIIAGAATPLVLNYMAQARMDRAKLDVKKLETAVSNYNLKHGVFPQTLMQLTQVDQETGAPPVLSESDLRDPWGGMYQYNAGALTTRGVPAITTTGPNGVQISNDSIK